MLAGVDGGFVCCEEGEGVGAVVGGFFVIVAGVGLGVLAVLGRCWWIVWEMRREDLRLAGFVGHWGVERESGGGG